MSERIAVVLLAGSWLAACGSTKDRSPCSPVALLAALREVRDELERPWRNLLTLMALASDCIEGSCVLVESHASGGWLHTTLLVNQPGSPTGFRAVWRHDEREPGEAYVVRHERKPVLILLGGHMWGEPAEVRRVLTGEGCLGILAESGFRKVRTELTNLLACLERQAAEDHAGSDATSRALEELLTEGVQNPVKWVHATEVILAAREPGWNAALIRALAARVEDPGRNLGLEHGVVVSRPGEPVKKRFLKTGNEWHWVARMLECRLYMPLGILDLGWSDSSLDERRRALKAARILVLLGPEAR